MHINISYQVKWRFLMFLAIAIAEATCLAMIMSVLFFPRIKIGKLSAPIAACPEEVV